MKKFIYKSFFFFIPVVFLFYIKPFYLLITDKYKSIVIGYEIYVSIDKSKQKTNHKKILIGDSVGRQLFNNTDKNDTLNSLASNQAIGVVGQYLVLNNYIKSGNKPEEVYLLYTPFSFKNNLNQIYTFHYFLKPFYTNEYKAQLSNTVIEQINKVPFSKFCHEPYILTSNWAPKYKDQDSTSYTFLSPISKEYLIKIKDLCKLHSIELYIIPTPTKEDKRSTVNSFNRNEFKGLNVENELNYYLNNIQYANDSFYLDNVHLKNPALFKSNVVNEIEKARADRKNNSNE